MAPYTYSSKTGTVVEGLDELIIAFKRLDSEKTNSYVVAATKESANKILVKARSILTSSTHGYGDLARSLAVKQAKIRSAKWSRSFVDQPVFVVGPRNVLRRGTKKSRGQRDRVNYGAQVELGHRLVINGKEVGHVKARPYLRPAADNSKEEVIRLVAQAMNRALEHFKEG